MSKLDLKPLRPCRRAVGISMGTATPGPEFIGWEVEPRRLGQLPWPRNALGQYATIAELMEKVIPLQQDAL